MISSAHRRVTRDDAESVANHPDDDDEKYYIKLYIIYVYFRALLLMNI